jgi:hypothetical protein
MQKITTAANILLPSHRSWHPYLNVAQEEDRRAGADLANPAKDAHCGGVSHSAVDNRSQHNVINTHNTPSIRTVMFCVRVKESSYFVFNLRLCRDKQARMRHLSLQYAVMPSII